MTEDRSPYNLEESSALSLIAFKNKACSLPYSKGYVAPEPQEISTLIKIMGWTQSDVAKLIGITYNPSKGSTTLRKWRAPKDKKEFREIPYAAWRLMLLYAGVVNTKDGKI